MDRCLKKRTCGLIVVFVDMNTCIFIEGRNLKTFLKENYAIALDFCYLFTKNVEHDVSVVLMEFACIR